MNEADANAAITAVDNLTVGAVTYEYSDTVADGNVISQDPSAGTPVPIGSSVDLVISLGQPQVPNVLDMNEADANAAITAVDNLTVADGNVISQDPVGGATVAVGSSVNLVVSSGQPEVPNVVDMNEADANAAITAVDNLTVGTVTYEYSDTVADGNVISQDPVGGTTVAVGSSVDLVVSSGQPLVPNVLDINEADANAAITAVDNLTVGAVTYEYSDTVADGNVISQDPAAGTPVPIGSSVDLVISLGQPAVPNVLDMNEADANAAITAVDNLIVGTVTYEYSDTVADGNVISQNPVGGATVAVGSSVDLVVSSGQPQVPNVLDMNEADANATITAVDNLTVGTVTYEYSDTVADGNVISQDPAAGTPVPIGSSVDLVVSSGQPEVPNVLDMNEADANAAITAVDNLTVGTVTYEYSDTVADDNVITQDPSAGTPVPIGSSVDLVISLGQPAVPNVLDMNEADANAAITAVDNLTVGTVTYEYSDTVADGNVISQDPSAGTEVPIGSSVNLVVSSGQPEVPNVYERG
jgi:beta-lactam-binding protein with PASTA domain